MYRRAFLIYNPSAGGRRAHGTRRQREMKEAMAVLRGQMESIEAKPTSGPNSAAGLAREACRRGADLVLALGGDGTINEVLNGLVGTPVPLAVLPGGTANVLAWEVGLPLDPVRAARVLPQLEPRRVSVGLVRCQSAAEAQRYFVLMAGIGVDARIVYTLDPRSKSRLGILSYWLAGLSLLGRRPEAFQVDIEGRRCGCTFALASKSRQYGGRLQIAHRAHLTSRDLEVVLFHTRSSLRYLLYLFGVATATLPRFSDVTFLRTGRMEISADEGARVYVQVDGEYVGRLPATVEVVSDFLTLLLPREYARSNG